MLRWLVSAFFAAQAAPAIYLWLRAPKAWLNAHATTWQRTTMVATAVANVWVSAGTLYAAPWAWYLALALCASALLLSTQDAVAARRAGNRRIGLLSSSLVSAHVVMAAILIAPSGRALFHD